VYGRGSLYPALGQGWASTVSVVTPDVEPAKFALPPNVAVS
jgi:hypothetical protein